jgi:hypothetical protein
MNKKDKILDKKRCDNTGGYYKQKIIQLQVKKKKKKQLKKK